MYCVYQQRNIPKLQSKNFVVFTLSCGQSPCDQYRPLSSKVVSAEGPFLHGLRVDYVNGTTTNRLRIAGIYAAVDYRWLHVRRYGSIAVAVTVTVAVDVASCTCACD